MERPRWIHDQTYRRVFWSTVGDVIANLPRYDLTIVHLNAMNGPKAEVQFWFEQLLRHTDRSVFALLPATNAAGWVDDLSRYSPAVDASGFMRFVPLTPPTILRSPGVVKKDDGKLVIVSDAELELATHNGRYLELVLGRHRWSSTLLVQTPEGRVLHTENLFDDEDSTAIVRVDVGHATSVVLKPSAHPRSQGNEVWVHEIK